MPTYEYRCPRCGKFEAQQKITESALEQCPTCQEGVKRLISRNVGIVFKGSGFYCTDNRPSAPSVSENACPAAPTAAEGTACAACPRNNG